MVRRLKLINIIKSVGMIVLVGFILFGLIYFISYLLGLKAFLPIILATTSTIFYIILSLFSGPKVILMSVGARPLEEHPRYYEVKEIVEELCKKAGIPVPKLYYFPSEDINAFATGFTPKNAYIAVTTGALKYLNREELAGVLGHEIAHIKNYDTLYMTVVSCIVGIISLICNYFIFFIHGDEEKPAWVYLLSIIISIITPFIAYLIQLALSREREYLADLISAELNGGPDGLISTFKKIEMINRGNIPYNEALEPLYFVSIEDLFSTHPPIYKRIKRLMEAYKK